MICIGDPGLDAIGQMSGNNLAFLKASVCRTIHIHPPNPYCHTRY